VNHAKDVLVGREGRREGGRACDGEVGVSEEGAYGCRFDGLGEADTMMVK